VSGRAAAVFFHEVLGTGWKATGKRMKTKGRRLLKRSAKKFCRNF